MPSAAGRRPTPGPDRWARVRLVGRSHSEMAQTALGHAYQSPCYTGVENDGWAMEYRRPE
jgi:hypothetical protein